LPSFLAPSISLVLSSAWLQAGVTPHATNPIQMLKETKPVKTKLTPTSVYRSYFASDPQAKLHEYKKEGGDVNSPGHGRSKT
jgi:hypothetical protein